MNSDANRRDLILNASFENFCAYGFRRTSMGDIAKSVGISRPALYLHFKNKDQIYSALAEKLFGESLDTTRAILSSKAPLESRLFEAIETGQIRYHHELSETPHGNELLALKNEIAPGLADQWWADMVEAFADALAKAKSRQTAESSARLIMDSIIGMKERQATPEEMTRLAKDLAKLVVGTS